jgi:predicted MFS family arabinose efflux permease
MREWSSQQPRLPNVKRPFLFEKFRPAGLVAAGTGLIAATYGLVRLAFGLFLPDVQSELGFDAAAAGYISSGASLVYCTGAVVGFFVAARHPRWMVLAAGLTGGLGAAGMAASSGTEMFATFSMLGSAGAGLASPGLVTLIGRNVSAGANDRSQAVVNAGTGPGLVSAGILALVLLPEWRSAWWVVAAFTVAVAVAVVALDRGHSVVGGRPQTDRGTAVRPGLPPGGWFTAHRRVILAALALGAGSAAVWNYGRTLLAGAGTSETTSVVAWIALGIGGAAVIGSAGIMSALQPRTAWTITAITVAATSTTLALVPHLTVVALVACAAFGWGYTASTNALIAWTIRIDPARAASGTSLLFVILVFGQAVGAALIGLLVSGLGLTGAFLAAAALALLAAVIPTVGSGARATAPQPERTETAQAPAQPAQTTLPGRKG